MDMHLTYYSVSSIIGMIIGLTMGIYLLTAKGGSAPMRSLGGLVLSAGFMNVAYFISSTFLIEQASYHRWITVPFGLCMNYFVIMFFCFYPNNRWPRFSKWFLLSLLGLMIVVTGMFWFKTAGSPVVYKFDGHYWNFTDQIMSRIVGVTILAMMFPYPVLALIKLRGSTRQEKWTIALIAGVLFLCGWAQGITNALSVQGAIGREVFQTTFSLTIVFGLFGAVVVFLNNTKDKTTFMARLVGISLSSVLMLMEAVSYYTLSDRSRIYDQLRLRDARSAVRGYLGEVAVQPAYVTGPGEVIPESLVIKDSLEEEKKRNRTSDLTHGSFLSLKDSFGKPVLLIHYAVESDQRKHNVFFPYESYREFVHEKAAIIANLLLVMGGVIVFIFPLFFRGALIRPLKRLLNAVRKVDEGDLETTVTATVQDEIGQLSNYFNNMVHSIRDSQNRLKDYADRLEEKVNERTAELQETLTKVQELKEQQDGDYFLTSLLIRPLQSNRTKSETVSVDFLVQQKKTFHFRRWEDQIGGDLCMADTINLKGRNYTLFMNADAMGKSMQGAGGALVLGAVLEAIIDRTLLSKQTSDQHPERWMKNSFAELHKVFETFDGSMLISMVLGLVDEETGLVYLMNAEHPWTVLYRKGKARFVEDGLHFRKLGTLGVESTLFVNTVQMEPGDVLIAGSDGRDDLIITESTGERKMQYDENIFLEHVEKAGTGDTVILKDIYDSLTSAGELTDDLSLLRIGYREDKSQIIHSESEDPAALKAKAGRLIKEKNYKEALDAAETYCQIRPGDTEMLFAVSVAAAKSGDLIKATDYGERVRLRDPENTRFLVHLARVYASRSVYGRAGNLIDEVMEVDPQNEKARQLRDQLAGSSSI